MHQVPETYDHWPAPRRRKRTTPTHGCFQPETEAKTTSALRAGDEDEHSLRHLAQNPVDVHWHFHSRENGAQRTIHVFWDFDPQSPSADPTEADSTQSCVADGETSARSLRICEDPFADPERPRRGLTDCDTTLCRIGLCWVCGRGLRIEVSEYVNSPQAAVVMAAAARAAAERHGDVAPSAAARTAKRAGSASAAAAATTAAAGCHAASRGAVPRGAAPSVAAGGRDEASAPPRQHPIATGTGQSGQWCAAPRMRSGVRQPMRVTQRYPPPHQQGPPRGRRRRRRRSRRRLSLPPQPPTTAPRAAPCRREEITGRQWLGWKAQRR